MLVIENENLGETCIRGQVEFPGNRGKGTTGHAFGDRRVESRKQVGVAPVSSLIPWNTEIYQKISLKGSIVAEKKI